jgi:UDP-glucose 4-epimerase
VHPKPTVDRNVAMTTSVCELVRSGAVGLLVQFSSSEVYGSELEGALAETHPYRPETPYAASKVACDLTADSYRRSFGIDLMVVRPFNNFGPRQNAGSYAGLIPTVCNRLESGSPVVIDGDGRQSRDFIYVRDTVAATIRAYERLPAVGEIVNLGAGAERTVQDVVEAILRAAGRPDWPVTHGPARPGDVRRHLADVTLARELLDFEAPTPFDEGIEATVAWYLGAPVH